MKCVLLITEGENVEGASELHRRGFDIEPRPATQYDSTEDSLRLNFVQMLRDGRYQKNDLIIFGGSDVCPLVNSITLELVLKHEFQEHSETDIFCLSPLLSSVCGSSFVGKEEVFFEDVKGETHDFGYGYVQRSFAFVVPAGKRAKVADVLAMSTLSIGMNLKSAHAEGELNMRIACRNLFHPLPRTPLSKNRRIAVVLPSYKRLPDLQRQIWCMMDQSYTNMHLFVAVKGIPEGVWRKAVLPLFEHFIKEGRLTMRLFSNKNQLSNILDAVRDVDVSSYDLFVKIDDDDFYGRDYCQAINDFHRMLPRYFSSNYSGSGHYLSNREGFPVINGGFFHYFGPTLAFGPEVLAKLFACERDPQHMRDISPGVRHAGYGFHEDELMHIVMREMGCCNRAFYINHRYLPMHLIVRNDNTSVMRGGLVSGAFWWKNLNITHRKDAEEIVLELSHPQWHDFLCILGNRARRLGFENSADVLSLTETELILKWDKWGTEIFGKRDDGIFVKKPSLVAEKSKTDRSKVAVVSVATGKHFKLWKECFDSCRNHFMKGQETHYFLLTDQQDIGEMPDVTFLYQKGLPPILESLYRFHLSPELESALAEYEYLYFLDCGLRFKADVGKEILPSDQQSIVAIRPAIMPEDYKMNISCGGDSRFFGGRRMDILHLCRELDSAIRGDMGNGFMADKFEEAYFNRCLSRKNVLMLDPVKIFLSFSTIEQEIINTPNKKSMNHSRIIHVVHSSWRGDCRIEGLRLFRTGDSNDMALITEWDGENPRAIFWPGYRSVEFLTWNSATDEFFITGRAGEWHAMSQAPSLTGAQYTIYEPSKTLMYLISKNACSTQIGTVLRELGYKPRQGSPSVVWGGEAYSHCLNNEDYDKEKYKDYTHMVVYHEPLTRFINLVNYTWCIQKGQLKPFVNSCKTKRQFLDTVHLLIRMNKANHPGPFEQHLEGQSWYYDRCPRIDVVVRMEDLSDYMKTVMGVEPCNCNVDGKHEITMEDLTEEDIVKIKEEWADDFLIEERYAPFFWNNTAK